MADRFHHGNGVAGADLVQAARVGLVAAVDRYDPGRPNPFIAHAIACINGELRRCLRDSSWRVHMSRTLKELALQVAKARDALTATLGRSSTLTGDYLGVASWLLPDAHLPAAAPGPAPDARPAGLSADRGWGGRPGKPPGPGRRRPVVGGGRQLGSPTGRSNPDGW
ncbi:MAG: sigma factor [Actinomycetes bacterium]